MVYREARGESIPLPQLRYQFIIGAEARQLEEKLHKASKTGYKPILMTIGNDGDIVLLTENPLNA